jgi:V8-like Glu-specific endopeptidase
MAKDRTRPTRRKSRSKGEDDVPMTWDMVARRENIPPSEPLPEEIARQFATPRLIVSSSDAHMDLAQHLARVSGERGVWQVSLPPGAIVGIPCRRAERVDPGSLGNLGGRSQTEPYRPPWVGLAFHPRLAGSPQPVALRNIKGERVLPHYIYRGDRQIIYPSGYPWHCVGRLLVWSDASHPSYDYSGSGVLVGPRTVLTAGHMAPWGSSNWKALFVPGYYDGSSVEGPGVSSWVTNAHGWNTGQVAAYDMAVFRLNDPLGSQLGTFGSKTWDDGWEDNAFMAIVGYAGHTALALGERPSFENSIAVIDDDSDGDAVELEHHGDSTPGDSGGPLWSLWNDQPYVIGTVSGEETISGGIFGIGDEDNNIAAGGKAMVDLIKWSQSNWPE